MAGEAFHRRVHGREGLLRKMMEAVPPKAHISAVITAAATALVGNSPSLSILKMLRNTTLTED